MKSNDIENHKQAELIRKFLHDDSAELDEAIEDLLLDSSLSEEVCAMLDEVWETMEVKEHPQIREEVFQRITSSPDPILHSRRQKHIVAFWSSIAVVLVLGIFCTYLFWNKHLYRDADIETTVATTTPIAPDTTTAAQTPTSVTSTAKVAQVTPRNVKTDTIKPPISEEISAPNTVTEVERRRITAVRSTERVTHQVAVGENLELILGDGSQVHVRGGSTLSYESFDRESRTVRLDGNAHFAVVKGSAPFIVESNGLSVRVTGTEFDVKNYSNDHIARVRIDEGSVVVATPSGVRYTLTVGNELIYDYSKQETIILVDKKAAVNVTTPQGESYYVDDGNELQYDENTKEVTIQKSKHNRKK